MHGLPRSAARRSTGAWAKTADQVGGALAKAKFCDRGDDEPMAARSRSGFFAQSLLGVVVALLALTAGAAPVRTVAGAALPAWAGSVDLDRPGTFTTQKTWLWCTAADVQIIRNIVDRATDHSRAAQQRYFDWMREHNRYDIPAADGVDPVGWTAGLSHFVDDRYRLVQSRSFDAALRSAVTSLRRTNLPVGITVGHGTHAWVVTGFSASADPAATTRFSVTSVRVVGPLWGLQSRSYGYDMRPGTKLTPKQLAGFFTPWHYAGIRMSWEGRWVSVQPIGSAAPAAPSATPAPSVRPTVALTPVPSTSAPPPTPAPTALLTGSARRDVALVASAGASGFTGPPSPVVGATSTDAALALVLVAAIGAALLALSALQIRRRGSG